MICKNVPRRIGEQVLLGDGVVVERLEPSYDSSHIYEVIAPDGYLFDGELSSLVCFGANDVRDRLVEAQLIKRLEEKQ